MNLVPLTDRIEIRRAHDRLVAQLTDGIQPLKRGVGYQGGTMQAKVYWRPAEQIWCCFEELTAEGRYWCAFGTTDPTTINSLTITCEINPPVVDFDRRCAGLFALDALGDIHLLHSGKLGGGRTGVSRTNFLAWNKTSERATVTWPDNRKTDTFRIGRLGNGLLPIHIAEYARLADDFKRYITRPV